MHPFYFMLVFIWNCFVNAFVVLYVSKDDSIHTVCILKKHDVISLLLPFLEGSGSFFLEQWIIFQIHVTDCMSHCQLSAAPQQSTEQNRLSPWWSGASHDDKEGREGQVEHAELMSQMSLLICSVNCISSDLSALCESERSLMWALTTLIIR